MWLAEALKIHLRVGPPLQITRGPTFAAARTRKSLQPWTHSATKAAKSWRFRRRPLAFVASKEVLHWTLEFGNPCRPRSAVTKSFTTIMPMALRRGRWLCCGWPWRRKASFLFRMRARNSLLSAGIAAAKGALSAKEVCAAFCMTSVGMKRKWKKNTRAMAMNATLWCTCTIIYNGNISLRDPTPSEIASNCWQKFAGKFEPCNIWSVRCARVTCPLWRLSRKSIWRRSNVPGE